MLLRSACFALTLCLAATTAVAEDRVVLGWGRLFDNDGLAEQADRWRTGSYTASLVTGPIWQGVAPSTFGSILEYRFRGEIIAPEDLDDPAPWDRRYAGALSFGLHSHVQRDWAEMSAGLDLVVTGPQTGLSSFQRDVHRALGMDIPSPQTNQIPNGIHPTFLGELAHRFDLAPTVVLRPFTEVQAGAETYIRVGADIQLGHYWDRALLMRDSPTGQLIRGPVLGEQGGLTFMLGGDYARVFDSVYLPSDASPELDANRMRLRGGLYYRAENWGVFYGVTWLSREFVGQPEGQAVGSVRIDMKF